MLKTISKYLLALFVTFIILIIVLNYIILPLLANNKKEVYLPYVKGLTLEEGSFLLKDFNIKVFYTAYQEEYSPNEILSTSPRAFTKVKHGRDIKITVVANKEDVIIDDFTNQSFRNINLYLDRMNIPLDTIIYEYSESINKDNIISQYPKKGKKIINNKGVTLIVSSGHPPDYYIVPNLINLSLNKAIKRIYESGLLVGEKKYEYVDTLLNNTVIQQNQPPFKRLSMPIEINLIISTDEKY